MLTLLLGRDQTANREEIFRRIAADVRLKKENRILMVPELISHDAERRLAAAAGNTASRYAQVLSFTRLGRRVMDIAGNAAKECLDDSGRVVAMAAAARQLHSRLKTYASVETKPEFLEQVLDAVDEFKRCCITAQDLSAAAGQTTGLLAQKLEELSLLLESYDALCALGKRDPRDQMTWVLEQLEQIDFAARHTFYVDGFPDFTRQNLAILEHIIASGTDVTVSLNCDSIQSGEMAFEKAAHTATELWQIAKRREMQVHIEAVSPRQDRLLPLRENLFQGKTAFRPELSCCVRAVRATSVYQECQVAARTIMEKVQQGCRYRDLAVVCTEPELYAPVLKLIFGKCQIPLYVTGTEPVLQSGVIATVIYGLEAALGGLEQRDVLRYLRAALSPISQDECDEVENYAVIWAIDRKRWTEPWTGHPQGLQGEWDSYSREKLEQLNVLRMALTQPLICLAQKFRESKNVADQVLAVYEFLENIQFCQRLQVLAKEVEAQGDDRTAQICNQLWEILLTALEQLYDVLGQTQWENDTFVRLLKLLLSQCKVGTIPPVLDAVSAGAVSAMRCQSEKHLIVLGANEGALPGYGGSCGILTDQERVELRNLGVPLTGGAMEGLQAEFAEIYGVFCGAQESVTVVCSDAQPSFVYRRLAAMSGGEIPADTALTAQLRQKMAAGAYLAGLEDETAAQRLKLEKEYREVCDRKRHTFGRVARKNVTGLYGEKLRLSASQVDSQAECRLMYFLKYGLRARERKQATVDPAEFGTYVHAVLENTCRTVMERGGFHAVTLEETLDLAHRYSEDYARSHFGDLESRRMEYLFRRNMAELETVVRELWRELSVAQYEPAFFELNFDKNGSMPAVNIPNGAVEAELRGFVDRVDLWKRGESTYFRVVDYKTGKKSFDYTDVFNGVGLQMLIYLFALEKNGEKLLAGKRISAGVLYFPARLPYKSVESSKTEEEAKAEHKSDWKRKGLLLADVDSLRAMDPSEKMDILDCSIKKGGELSGSVADRGQLGKLSDYMMKVLGKMAEDIASGNVEPNPYIRDENTSICNFCPYGAVCHKQSVSGQRRYAAMKPEEFWRAIEKEEKGRG